MSESQLDAFLGKDDSEPAPVADTPPPTSDHPPESEPKESEPAPKVEDDEEDDGLPKAESVPFKAYEAEKRGRRDWKEKATRAEVERDMLAKQLEELKKAPPPPPTAREPLPPIDPAQDPQGFVARIQSVMLNERLNTSELLLRKELGAEKVEAAIAEFKQAAEADPTLYGKLYQQNDPYGWMAREVERMRLQREVGDDPVKWREAERERIRQEIEAERSAQPTTPVSPVAGLPPSLATVRSAASRSAPTDTGDMSLDDLVKDIRAASVRRK